MGDRMIIYLNLFKQDFNCKTEMYQSIKGDHNYICQLEMYLRNI